MTVRTIDPAWDGKSCPYCGETEMIASTRFRIINRCLKCGCTFVTKEDVEEQNKQSEAEVADRNA